TAGAGRRAHGQPRRGHRGQGSRTVPRAGTRPGQRGDRRHAQRAPRGPHGPRGAAPRRPARVASYSCGTVTSTSWPSTVIVAVSPSIWTLPNSPISTVAVSAPELAAAMFDATNDPVIAPAIAATMR